MLGIRFIKTDPTTYLLQYRKGHVIREGVGMSFFYYSPSTSLVGCWPRPSTLRLQVSQCSTPGDSSLAATRHSANTSDLAPTA